MEQKGKTHSNWHPTKSKPRLSPPPQQPLPAPPHESKSSNCKNELGQSKNLRPRLKGSQTTCRGYPDNLMPRGNFHRNRGARNRGGSHSHYSAVNRGRVQRRGNFNRHRGGRRSHYSPVIHGVNSEYIYIGNGNCFAPGHTGMYIHVSTLSFALILALCHSQKI